MRLFKLPRILLVLALLALVSVTRAGPAHAGSFPNRLDDNRVAGTIELAGVTALLSALTGLPLFLIPLVFHGRVVDNPDYFNVFWSDDWNADSPQATTQDINGFTQKVVNSNYFDGAAEYGVGNAHFRGSHVASACGSPGSTESFASILGWITCEVQLPGTSVPFPDGNSVYNVFLPPQTTPAEAGPGCAGFGGYHAMTAALTVEIEIIIPVVTIQDYPYTVLPTACAHGSFDELTSLSTHEMIEAATDPNFGIGWIDLSTFDFSSPANIAHAGEAGDICEIGTGSEPTDHVRLNNGVLVAPYWSNSAQACFPTTHTVTLKQTGLPGTVSATASVTGAAINGDTDPHNVFLPFSQQVVDGASFSFSYPTPVGDPGNAGIRYVTTDTGQNVSSLASDLSDTATYSQEDFLTVNTNPAQPTMPAPPSLTPSGWKPHNSVQNLTTDALVDSPPDRYRFDNWQGDLSSLNQNTTITMSGPKTATAQYVLQHLVTFDETGIPGFPWTITVDGTGHSGPFSDWFDHGSSHTFSYQSPVPGGPGDRFVLTGTSEASPATVTSTHTILGNYKTQHSLTVKTSGLPAPNLTHIFNSGAGLGTANDSTPLLVWLDHGTPLSLDADANVNGAAGIQYFDQGFSPYPSTLQAAATTTVTYETMEQLINDALNGGGMSGPNAKGVGTALKQKFAAVQSDMAAAHYNAALGSLNAFLNQVQAQCCSPHPGKAISAATAKTLQLDDLLVFHNALCLGIAAGQISPTQASKSYADYKNLVTSLGGTVLPPC